MTKVFTALALADAVVRREVSLATPLSELLPPGARVPSAGGRHITLEHLATHTSGLPRSPIGLVAELRSAAWTGANPYAQLDAEALYEALARTRLRRKPGTGPVRYSNFGAALLGQALATASSGGDYGALVCARICDPLGLADTVVAAGPAQVSRLATGHRRGRAMPHWDLPGMAGAGALHSTGADLLAFVRAQLQPDQTPLAAAIKLTHRERRPGGRSDIGLGWMRTWLGGTTMLWHNGGTGGFRSITALMPDRGVGVVVLVNNFRSPDRAGLRLLRAVGTGPDPDPAAVHPTVEVTRSWWRTR